MKVSATTFNKEVIVEESCGDDSNHIGYEFPIHVLTHTLPMYYISQTTFPSKKANAIQQLKMCQAFVEAGENVTLVFPRSSMSGDQPTWETLSKSYGLSTEFDVVGVKSLKGRFTTVPQIGFFSLGASVAAWICRRILTGSINNEDIIYSRNYYASYFLSEFIKLLPASRRPSIYSEYHSLYTHRLFTNRFFKNLDGIISITELLKNDLVEMYPLLPEKCFVAPDGVDLGEYQGITTEKARERVGVPRDEFVVMYTGHVYPRKGAQLLVEAGPDIDGLVYIVGGYDEDIDRIKSNYTVPNNVHFTGFVDPSEMPYYQYSADVLVAPYTSDALRHISPLKIFEYMATGTPIVASNFPVLKEILSHEDNALFIDQDDPNALATGINRLRTDPDLAESIADQARTDVKQYSWRARAENILEFINETS